MPTMQLSSPSHPPRRTDLTSLTSGHTDNWKSCFWRLFAEKTDEEQRLACDFYGEDFDRRLLDLHLSTLKAHFPATSQVYITVNLWCQGVHPKHECSWTLLNQWGRHSPAADPGTSIDQCCQRTNF